MVKHLPKQVWSRVIKDWGSAKWTGENEGKGGSSKFASSGVWLCSAKRKACWWSSTQTYLSICRNMEWIMSPVSREQATYPGWRWPHWLVKHPRSKLGLPWSGRCWDLQKMHSSWLRHDHENVLSSLAGERPEKIWEELWERYWFTSRDPPLIQPGSAKQTEQPQFKNTDFSSHLYCFCSPARFFRRAVQGFRCCQ